MNKRLELHEILCDIINITESDGDRHVYFQPPESLKMKYPAIRYSLRDMGKTKANNKTYNKLMSYEIIVIDKNPDSSIPFKVLELSYCRFDRFYIADNLNHYVFTIYY